MKRKFVIVGTLICLCFTLVNVLTPIFAIDSLDGVGSLNSNESKQSSGNRKIADTQEDNISQYVAKIGDKGYDSLPQAIKNSNTNDTILLLKDISLKSQTDGDFRDGSSVTLDLNKSTVIGDNKNAALRVVNNDKVRIVNGKITAINGTYCTLIVNGSEVELENIEIENSTPNGNSLKCVENSTLHVKNVSSTSYMGGGVEAAGGTIHISKSSFVQEGYFDHASQIVAASQGGVVNVYDGTFIAKSENYGAYIYTTGGTINIHGGEWLAGKAVLKADNSETSDQSVINVYGGSFDGKIQIQNKSLLNIRKGIFKNTGLSIDKMSQYVSQTSSIIEKGDSFVVYPKASHIKLPSSSLVLKIGETKLLTALVEPTDTLDQPVYSSSDLGIVSVDSTGRLKGLKEGRAIVTASVGTLKAECIVTILKEEKPVIPSLPDTPVEQPTIGITEEGSKEIIHNTSSRLLESLARNDKVDEAIMSKGVQERVLKAIESGKSITTHVASRVVDIKSLGNEVLDKMEAEMKELGATHNTKIFVAQYLDLGIMLKTSDEDLGNIKKLDEPITFTLAIPDTLKGEGRKYYVVRFHEGKAETLETILNRNGTLSFKTDSFSTYALVYEEEVKELNKPDIELSNSQPTQLDETTVSSIVDTSDSAPIMIMLNILTIALFVGIKILVSKRI